MNWKEYKKKWKDCAACDLAKTRHNIVLARGSVPCDVLFIGEAPGVSEDRLGKPFVGPAGKLMDYIIEQGLRSAPDTILTYALTNLVACIPLSQETGRKVDEPDKKHIKACSDRLLDFVELCDPSLIVLVGTLSAKYPPELDREYVKIVHPAFILRMNIAGRDLEIKKCIVTISEAVEELV